MKYLSEMQIFIRGNSSAPKRAVGSPSELTLSKVRHTYWLRFIFYLTEFQPRISREQGDGRVHGNTHTFLVL